MKCLMLFIALIAYVNAVSEIKVRGEEWKAFKMMHSKQYDNRAEESIRFKIYMENRHLIAKHNQKYAKKEVSYQMAVNELSDMTSEEFLYTMTSRVFENITITDIFGANGQTATAFMFADNVELPSQTDWRSQGAVTKVKSQGQCGSCWAFSVTGALEGQHFRKTGKLVSLSEQNLIDCSKKYGNHGCNGGWMNNGFRYIKENGGIDTEDSYAYLGTDHQQCKFRKETIGATSTGYTVIPPNNEKQLLNAVATVGPITVAIQVTSSFQSYHGGVYYEPRCDPKKLNHAVLIVGYGSEGGHDYWLVKNSWGTSWGQEGYIKMARNKNNNCGIASAASYPLV